RREPEDAGNVVEPVTRVVSREHRRDVEVSRIEVHRQEIANRIVVLGAIEAVECLRAAGIRMSRPGSIQLGFKPGSEPVGGPLFRRARARRRNKADTKLSDDFSPSLRTGPYF